MKSKTIIISVIICIFIVVLFIVLNKKDPSNGETETREYIIDGDITYLNTAPGVKYHGRESCRECHEEIYNAYVHSQTGRSMTRMDASNIIEDFPQKNAVYDSSLNYYYEMVQIDDRFFQREYRLDENNKVVHERIEEAQYIIGSGKNLRMYFYEDNGMYYQLPLTWYVHENRWDMSPGYREFNNFRFSRFVSPMCFSCHNGHMEISATTIDRYQGNIHLGIGCESCHGPGDLHIRKENDEDINLPFDNAETIVNPAKLSPKRRIDVCQQCHFEGEAWALVGHNSWFDFRPGMLLNSHRSVYSLEEASKEAFRVANSAYRLSLSRCFTGSHKTMTCDLCHDPHGLTELSSIEFNRQNCQKCHPPQSLPGEKSRFAHSEDNDCIPCHMMRTGTENTLHGVINTDHWIRIDANKDTIDWTLLREVSLENPVETLSPVINLGDENSDLRKGIAYFDFWREKSIITAYLDSAYYYVSKGLEYSKENAIGYYYLGMIHYYRGDYSKAISALNEALSIQLGDAHIYFALGEVYSASDNQELAITNFRKAIEILPDEPRYLEKLGLELVNSGEIDEAITTLEFALTKDKQNPYVYYTLGNLYARNLNDPNNAVSYFERAVVLDPDIPDGFLNLGNTHSLLGNYDEAINSYKKDYLFNPQSTNTLVNMGRLYYNLGKYSDARSAFEEALRIDPGLKVAQQFLEEMKDFE
jgi:tetratricopeptide (TPR) repeat protein